MHVRNIKTGRTHFPVVPGRSNNFTGLRAIPWIRLQGAWLEEAGFLVGQPLKVEVQRKRLIISPK
ncbi:SymE family type I addiction module toxin [Cupriavidus consociatus]|uniref:SymE family type I addiction module toxin n=1 Tax=Cupriavidus consociatus TaxID=2821357 RepID=UPI001FD7E719|nr:MULTISPECIES: SymE family type I addiction module toxin [unclassified Cupriavidus]MDK2659623.1 SymE family type I addiction module toxin [Cupriavidus sp. LEh21]